MEVQLTSYAVLSVVTSLYPNLFATCKYLRDMFITIILNMANVFFFLLV